jgi:hypothetical protein
MAGFVCFAVRDYLFMAVFSRLSAEQYKEMAARYEEPVAIGGQCASIRVRQS